MICQVVDVKKSYFNNQSDLQRAVLKGVSFTLEPGSTMSIVGPSGSGKSTLLNIIGTLDLPTSGKVLIDGQDIALYSDNQLATIRNQQIGFVYQSHHLLPQLNLLENVLLPTLPVREKSKRKMALERAMFLLDSVGLADKIHQLPGQLSGGECQRTAVIRAMINRPKLILADEPTGSLDDSSAGRIGELLLRLNQQEQVALMVVTHSVKLADVIGNVHYLEGGKLSLK